MKNSFVFHIKKYKKLFEKLDGDHAKALILAMCQYTETGEISEMDTVSEIAFAGVQGQMDEDIKKWETTCEARSAAGKLGGRPPKAKKANGFNEKQMVSEKAKEAECECEYECEGDTKVGEVARAYMKFYGENIGVITPFIVQEIESFIDDGLCDDMIVMALEQSVDADKPWQYAKAVLNKWLEKKILTVEQAKAEQTEFKNRKCRGKPKNVAERTYTAEEKKQREIDAFAEMEQLWEENNNA